MYREQFEILDRTFQSDKSEFDRLLLELTPDILNRYLDSQEGTNDIFEYIEEHHPKFLVQAFWADDPSNTLRIFAGIPANFNPHSILKS